MLTVNGKAEVVVVDAAAYPRLLARVEEARAIEAIRQGMEDRRAGRTIGLDEFREHARRTHGIEL